MVKKSILVTILFIISTFVQLISQIVITRIFGARFDLDVFLAAVTLPTIAVTVIYGTLNDAFLPQYGEEKIKNPQNANTYFYSHTLILTVLSFFIAWIFGFFAEPLSNLLYGSRGDEFVKLVAVQMFYMSFSIPLAVIAALFGAHYYIHKSFSRFPFAQLVGSVISLFLIVILVPVMGIWALVFAFIINILFQILLVVPNNLFHFKFKMINIVPLLLAWIPLLIGNFALRSDTLLVRSFASSLPTGYLVYLNLIFKMFSLAASVMTIGIQVVLLPHLVEQFAKKEYQKAFENINRSKIIAVAISIIVTITITLFVPLIINILFTGGKFTKQDADITIMLFPMFIIPAVGWGIAGVFFQPLLALRKQVHLGALNVAALVLGWGTAAVINRFFGPLPAITVGLIVLLFTGIIGSEILWQIEKKKILTRS